MYTLCVSRECWQRPKQGLSWQAYALSNPGMAWKEEREEEGQPFSFLWNEPPLAAAAPPTMLPFPSLCATTARRMQLYYTSSWNQGRLPREQECAEIREYSRESENVLNEQHRWQRFEERTSTAVPMDGARGSMANPGTKNTGRHLVKKAAPGAKALKIPSTLPGTIISRKIMAANRTILASRRQDHHERIQAIREMGEGHWRHRPVFETQWLIPNRRDARVFVISQSWSTAFPSDRSLNDPRLLHRRSMGHFFQLNSYLDISQSLITLHIWVLRKNGWPGSMM